MSDGERPDLVVITDDAYETVLRTLYDQGFFEGKSWEDVLGEQPDVGPRRRCAMGEAALSAPARWPMLDVTFSHQLTSLPGVTVAQADQIYRKAAAIWSQVCGIRLAYATNFDAANIYAVSTRMDGRSGTLADSYLPVGVNSRSRLRQRYDDSETWTMAWLLEVVLHEMGHALGLEHDQTKGTLMYPYSSGGTIQLPTARDISRVVALYGAASVPAGHDLATFDGVLIANGQTFSVSHNAVTISGRAYTVHLEPAT